MREINHTFDVCVVGGGLAGMCAAIAAARRGAKTVLVQDRPVLGGNASSEIRMWIGGAHGKGLREAGIIEEIELANILRNPLSNYSTWDSILYEKVRFQPNLTSLLNCTVNGLTMDGDRIASVRAWQLTTETWHTIHARLFADCSGDSILAPLSGAEFRIGREAAAEFNEDIEPPVGDTRTMGMSCLLQLREMPEPQPYTPPSWANRYETDADLPNRHHGIPGNNFWWVELGGEQDSIHDTETLRDELLKAAFGIWDHIKNRGEHGAANWVLDWVGFLPGKRESRRYVGDHILTQNDVRAGGPFEDVVAYGGWSMDDHHPAGLRHPGKPTVFHPAPSPYGIPYRCLYSRNIANLFCAGRNISTTHAALSSTRVMATCAILGQAAGTAAALAIRDGLLPRGVYEKLRAELQQALMDDDCYLPGLKREIATISRTAQLTASVGAPETLRDGYDRTVGDEDHAWIAAPGAWAEYRWARPARIRRVRLVLDSDLSRKNCTNMRCDYPLNQKRRAMPASLLRAFRLEIEDAPGEWRVIHRAEQNDRRLIRIDGDWTARAVRLVPEATWGSPETRVFAWDLR